MKKPRHKPTEESRKLVEHLAGVGLPHEMICAVVGVKVKETLYHHYREELDRGRAKACAAVGKKLFQKCMEGDTTSIIFWCKTQMGFKEIERKELDMTITDKTKAERDRIARAARGDTDL